MEELKKYKIKSARLDFSVKSDENLGIFFYYGLMAVFVFHEQSLFPIYFKVKHRQPTEAPFYPTLHEDASI